MRWRAVALAAALVCYAGMLVRHLSYVAGGADSSGYLNEARMLASGRIRRPIEPLRALKLPSDFAEVFTPLGFMPANNRRLMVPTYPAGLPVHFAIGGRLAGWKAALLIEPLAAVGSLILMFLAARELGLSRGSSLAGAAILAATPVFIMYSIQPMSDGVATFWALLAIWFALRAERRRWLAAAAGAGFAVGVWVRPTNILMAIPLAFALRWRRVPLLLAAAAAAPFALALMGWNGALYGSPLRTGYGSFAEMVAWQFPRERLPHYSYWLAAQLTPLVFPGGLFVSVDRRIETSRRAMLLSWFLAFFVFYCFYSPYEEWWYTRFLLPAIPPLILGFLLLLRDLRPQRVVGASLVIAIIAVGVLESRRFHVLDTARGELIYPETIRWAEQRLPADAIVVSMQMSGALLYYSDRFTVRWDMLDPDRFELLRAYVGSANLHWYALISAFESEEMRKRLPGNWSVVGKNRDVTLWRLDS